MIDIKCGNCMDLIKEIPDESINMILCDLPYEETGNKWDKVLDLQELFNQYKRIIKENGCIALTGTLKFGIQLYNVASDLYKYEWIWEKDNGTNIPNVKYQPFRVHEYVFIFGKGRITNGTRQPMKYNPQMAFGDPYTHVSGAICSDNWKGGMGTRYLTENPDGLRFPRSIQKFSRDKDYYHPTQKPVELLKFLIKSYTDVGDVVLDNCMGSGSTGVACRILKRDFIGYELNEEYFKIAKARIEDGYYDKFEDNKKIKQIKLF